MQYNMITLLIIITMQERQGDPMAYVVSESTKQKVQPSSGPASLPQLSHRPRLSQCNFSITAHSKKCWAFGPGILCCNSTWSKRDNQPSPCGQQTKHYHTGAPFLYCSLRRSVNLIYFHHLWSCGKSICSRVISFGIWLALALSISHELFPKKNQMCTTCSLHGINTF